MSKIDSILASMKSETYSAKQQLLQYLLHLLQNNKSAFSQAEKTALLDYANDESDTILADIAKAATYKEKDLIFAYEDLLLDLLMQLYPSSSQLPEELLNKIMLVNNTIQKERYIETALSELFQQEQITESEIDALLVLVEKITEPYHRDMILTGLLHYAQRQQTGKLTDTAKARIATHLACELERHTNCDPLTDDIINSLELIADVCRYFPNTAVLQLLQQVLLLGHNNINFYAVRTLLVHGQTIPTNTLTALAKDLEYANLTYHMLGQFQKQEFFPADYSTPEYLAKSDMVHWLMHPNELGKAPNEIVYLGKITYLFKKDTYYVFKYRSDSQNLGKELTNKWLIGWSSEDGGTFSNFDEYALYEKSTVKATLKNIKKKLIG